MMSPETREEIVRHAVRWTTNILTEVSGNHAKYLTDYSRDTLKRAIEALYEASRVVEVKRDE